MLNWINKLRNPNKFYNEIFCVSCNEILSSDEQMYSNGRCPKCGYKDEDACTVVKTYDRGYRWINGKKDYFKDI
jgi:predicted RNA-binding Zn-ribbon protein involved in translation (DUF1610 family)